MNDEQTEIELDANAVIKAYQGELARLSNENILLKAQLIQVSEQNAAEDSGEKEQS